MDIKPYMNMPCSATAEELRTDAGTKSDMPQATMNWREIAEAFVADDDADVIGLIVNLFELRRKSRAGEDVKFGIEALCADIYNHVEGL